MPVYKFKQDMEIAREIVGNHIPSAKRQRLTYVQSNLPPNLT